MQRETQGVSSNWKSSIQFAMLTILFCIPQDMSQQGSGAGKADRWHWAVSSLRGRFHTQARDVVASEQGGAFVTGFISIETVFGEEVARVEDEGALFVARYSEKGDVAWVKSLGDRGTASGSGITISNSGVVYITGSLGSSISKGNPGLMNFPGGKLESHSKGNVILLAMSKAGDVLWATQLICEGNASGEKVAVDREGNVFVSGSFDGVLLARGQQASQGLDFFVSKFDKKGNLVWLQTAGGRGRDEAKGIVADQKGNCYVTGFFQRDAQFGGMTLEDRGNTDFFLAKYTLEGSVAWVKRGGGDGLAYGIAVDREGSLYVTGGFSGKLGAGSTEIQSSVDPRSVGPPTRDMFLMKFDNNGRSMWGSVNGFGIGSDFGESIDIDKDGAIYVTGSFFVPFQEGEKETPRGDSRRGHIQMFLAKYNSHGNMEWLDQSKGSRNSSCEATSVSVNQLGGGYVTGFYSGSVVVGNSQLDSRGGDIFLGRFRLQRP
ncbi:MAG: hypothetical protein WEB33_12250 [Bacteroidota bacterium]